MKTTKELLEAIAEDLKNDAEHFDGQAFNGRNVAEYFGRQGAAIAALASIVKSILEQVNANEERTMHR